MSRGCEREFAANFSGDTSFSSSSSSSKIKIEDEHEHEDEPLVPFSAGGGSAGVYTGHRRSDLAITACCSCATRRVRRPFRE